MSTKRDRARQPPTMADVARLAGVNRVTASVALRGVRAGTHVSEETRQRILAAAKQLGYTPNAIALALRRQRTDLIGYYVAHGYLSPYDPFTAAVIDGLQTGCNRHHQDLLMYGGFERRSPDEIYAAMSGGKIDGLVLLPAPHNPVLDKLAGSHLPVVALANRFGGLPYVGMNDAQSGPLIADYLAQRGHRHILYRSDKYALDSALLRLRAFQEAAARHGLTVTLGHPRDDYGHLGEQERALLLGPSSQRPTAAVCWVDSSAYTLLEECQTLGLRVPEDLAVVGFDGVQLRIPPARLLTTIRAPWTEAAGAAVDVLIALIEGRTAPQETIFPVELMVGDTT